MKKYFIANWKSNKSSETAQVWLDSFTNMPALSDVLHTREIVIIPSFVQLAQVANAMQSTGVKVGVQDISNFAAGSYTGAISAQNLAGHDVQYVLLGHSERRLHFGETDEVVAKKVDLALDAGITPILCVDEPYLDSQLAVLDSHIYERLIIAYEPVAAIGTGNRESVGKVTEVKGNIEKVLGPVPVLYGGSVDENSVSEYLLVCDGVLVGSASLKANQFMKLIENGTP